MDIALIDSGINPWHSHVMGVAGGIAFSLDRAGNVLKSPDFFDRLGHGTALAGIIREKAPLARLYAVKIFHQDLRASTVLLRAALEWAVGEGIKVIHLSLGTEREEDGIYLSRLCREAYEGGIVIVAAARKPRDGVFPAVLETVVGVCWDRRCGDADLSYFHGCPVEFGSYGLPRALEGLPQEFNCRGNSFAAARVTARIVQLLEENPAAGTSWVKEALIRAANRRTSGDEWEKWQYNEESSA